MWIDREAANPYYAKKGLFYLCMGLTSQAKADKSQRWWHLSSIQLAGGVISIPVMAVGAQILCCFGYFYSILSIIFGNFIVLLVSFCVISISNQNRLNAVETVRQFVGSIGARIFAFLVLLSMIGWVASDLFDGLQILRKLPIFAKIPIDSVIGIAASLILLSGIRGLKKVCLYSIIPLVILLLGLMYYVMPHQNLADVPIHVKPFNLSGISLVISSSVAAVVDYPTFFRHRKTKYDSIFALFVIFAFTSAIQIMGIFIVKLVTFDDGMITQVISQDTLKCFIASAFLILSTLTSVCWNIYAASVGWESLFPIFKDRTEYAVIGLLATLLLSYQGLVKSLISAAGLCDSIMSAIAGILVYEFIALQKIRKNIHLPTKEVRSNDLSWFFGALLASLAFFHVIPSPETSTFLGLLGGFLAATVLNGMRKITR